MPRYEFECNHCHDRQTFTAQASQFDKLKEFVSDPLGNPIELKDCQRPGFCPGLLEHKITPFTFRMT